MSVMLPSFFANTVTLEPSSMEDFITPTSAQKIDLYTSQTSRYIVRHDSDKQKTAKNDAWVVEIIEMYQVRLLTYT